MLSRFPFPLEKGDKLRAFNQIRELSDDFEIHLIAISGTSISDETKNKLAPYCQSIHIIRINAWSIFLNCCLCLLSNKPFQTGYFYSYAGKQKVKQLENFETANIDSISIDGKEGEIQLNLLNSIIKNWKVELNEMIKNLQNDGIPLLHITQDFKNKIYLKHNFNG